MVRYLITNGTSKTGSATIVALKNLGVAASDIVAGTRDPTRNESRLKDLGAGHVVLFDFGNEESIEKALIDIDRVALSVGATLRISSAYSLVERLASRPGSKVTSIVAIGAILNGNGEVAKDFALAHKAIIESKVENAIVVSPNWFFENWQLPGLLAQIKAGTVYGSSGDGKVAMIAVQDIGNVVGAVLLNPHKYNRQTLEISGPEAATEAEYVSIVAKLGLGKPEGATYVNVSEAAFRDVLASAQIPQGWIDYLSELEAIKASGHAGTVTSTVKDVTGKEPISISTWAQEHAAELAQA